MADSSQYASHHSPASVLITHIQLGLTYDHLANVDAPALHVPATSSVSRLRRSTEALPSIYFDKPSIARLMDPQAMLNDTCMNEGLQLLISHFQPDHLDRCAIFTTYTMAYVQEEADDATLWRDVRYRAYWEKPIWVIPVHLQHPYLHWTLCIVNTDTTTIRLFDSVADESLWMDNVKVSTVNIYSSYMPHDVHRTRLI